MAVVDDRLETADMLSLGTTFFKHVAVSVSLTFCEDADGWFFPSLLKGILNPTKFKLSHNIPSFTCLSKIEF